MAATPENAGFDNFSTTAMMGLTSTFVEEVNIGRQTFVKEKEDQITSGEYVLRLVLDLNTLLSQNEIFPPRNDNLNDAELTVSYEQVSKFEQQIKNASSTYTDGSATLLKQVRTFLGVFFDRSKDLNDIDQNDYTNAIVKLDDGKIANALVPDTTGTAPDLITYNATDNYKPLGENLGSRLLTTRQIAQVLDAYVALGVDGDASRCQRVPPSAGSTDYTLKFGFRTGDSIIAACTVYDNDAADKDVQHSQKVKVMLEQGANGAWDGTTHSDLAST